MKSHWITYKGKQILYCDYSNFRSDVQALRAENDAADVIICQQPEGLVLSLSNVENTVASTEVINLFKLSASRTKRYVRKQAVIGVTGLRRMLAEAVARSSGQELTYFEDIEKAKDWLVAE